MVFNLCVCLFVKDQTPILSKGFGALLALIRLFATVYPVMAGQMVTLSKGLGAQLALVWLFTCVCLTVAD